MQCIVIYPLVPQSLRLIFTTIVFFFFQAEDGIRDKLVTGVQTCALPIFSVKEVVDLARQLHLFLFGELLFVDVDDLLDGDVGPPELLAQLAEPLERQVGAEDRVGDLVLAFLDALGQRDLTLAREQGDTAHLAQVEPDGVLGPADRAGREVDRLRPLLVWLLGRNSTLDLGGQARRLGGVDHLDVHRAEHHHDVVELIERHDVRREGVVHLVVGEEALLLAHRDQAVELLDLWFFTHASGLLGDPSGPGWCAGATPSVLACTSRPSRSSRRGSSTSGGCGASPPCASAIRRLTSRMRRRRWASSRRRWKSAVLAWGSLPPCASSSTRSAASRLRAVSSRSVVRLSAGASARALSAATMARTASPPSSLSSISGSSAGRAASWCSRRRTRARSSARPADVGAGRGAAPGLRRADCSRWASIQSWVGSTPSLAAASRESATASSASPTLASISATRANAVARARAPVAPSGSATARSSA